MKKLTTSILFLLAIAMAPAQTLADIKVSISDGTTTRANTTAGPTVTGGFNLTRTAPMWDDTQIGNHTLMLLGDCSATSQTGCARVRFFPSGCNPTAVVDDPNRCANATTGNANDTFKIQDIASTNRARIEKIDLPVGAENSAAGAATGADSVVLKGVKIFALAGGVGKTFTLIYATESGDLTEITSATGNYLATAKIKGQFRLDTTAPIDGNNGNIAATCNNGESNPCVKLVLEINALTLNGQGSNATGVVTAAVPCQTNSPISPCGTGGFWSPTLLSGDQFLASDSGSVGCGESCIPYQKGTLTASFSAANQVLTLQNSAGGGLAPDTTDGLLALGGALGEPGIDQWLASCSGDQRYQVVGLPPLNKQTRNQNDSAALPLKFSLLTANLVSATGGFTMESVVDGTAEAVLPPSDRAKNDFCILSRIFSSTTRPALKNIGPFTLSWTDFVVGSATSINSALGMITFSDCTACFRVEVELLKDGISAGKLKIYLGSGGPNNTTNHDDTSTTTPLDFFADSALRVDPQGLDFDLLNKTPEACCITFSDAASNGKYGKLLVRAVSVVLDHGPVNNTPVVPNHQVKSVVAVVDGNSSSSQLLVVDPIYTPSCNWPPVDGLVMQIYKDTGTPTAPALTWARTVVDTTINECTLTASVKVQDFATGANGSGDYEVQVTAFSGASNPAAEFKGGISLPGLGAFTLK